MAGRRWRRLKDRMASCDLDVVNPHGCRVLCRFMYTEHGFAMPTMHDGGSHVHYREVATELWEQLAKRNSGRPGSRKAGAIARWPSSVKIAEQREVWCELVRALPLVDEWPFWTGDEAYPTTTMGYFYDKAIRHATPGPYLWSQATSVPKPLVSDLLPGPKAPLPVGATRCCLRLRTHVRVSLSDRHGKSALTKRCCKPPMGQPAASRLHARGYKSSARNH